MENTGNVSIPTFANDQPQWYIALGDRWVGPLTAADVYQKVIDQEIGWAHFVWRPGQTGWERICDLKIFQVAVPQLPDKGLQKEVKEAVKAEPTVRTATRRSSGEWFVCYNDAQYGPFSAAEIERHLKVGKLNDRVFGWRDGMDNWRRLGEIAEFAEAAKAQKPTPPSKPPKAQDKGAERRQSPRIEQRNTPRRPLVARILMTDQSEVAIAVCRDISVGGMQVLTDRIPGNVGAKIRLNVSTTERKIEPFAAEGIIVRILEDGRGFSFRFDGLTENAKRNIESYIG